MSIELNITQEAIAYILSAGITFLLGIMVLVQYRRAKLRHLLYMCLSIISIGGFSLSQGLAVLFLFPPLIQLRNLFLIPLALFIVVLMDSITRDSADPVKLAFNVGLFVALGIYNSDPASVGPGPFPNGDASLMNIGFEITAIKMTLLIWIAACSLVAFLRIYTHAPKPFRKYVLLSLLGIIGIGPVGIISAFTIELSFPGFTAFAQLLGTLALGLGISLKPNLAFVLPFRAIRLTVIRTDSGVPLFTFTWEGETQLNDPILFSGIIQGITSILKESVAGGEVEEIKLSNAVLLLQRAKDANIACVLVSTKTSTILRGALGLFLDRFLKTYAQELKDPSKISQFDTASNLVTQTFPFIPAYER